ncbi:S-adenosyl-L-methionine-dependent methyltransferase [Cutaneotrichosporon oleaginosum]|uniref:S-adenosyl-L-methionine-dependent methyltransferase n=1 Tax=Cutaneotrichosporon oleaginosum TaxID=879819 RepID=A0A0J0XCL5_9TREE|nr:S-adenosyl-L-methionine-dependent methyltransferase [Cutaneotrichosporon oleaginosum]KLT38806.1 S-adenosyl-L-methionine-dependent methyltransferase [Cutaneotrichosporon oleaginosum]TXT06212.1 hypothetical protein COLE_05543 [Cutaneotrichosporon oleaginosum]
MATFAKSSFDAAGYLASRPTYPAKLYDLILAYHRGGRAHALDMGCGPGFMAVALSPHFSRVSAQDPSEKMVSVGLQPADGHISYSLGSAEDMSALPAHSVDLAVAGQAAHWFDHKRAWSELARILAPRGTVAYVGYGEMGVTGHARASAVFRDLVRGDMGAFWPQPGRSIVEGLLDAVPFPVAPALDARTEARLARIPSLEGGMPVAARIREPEAVDGEGWDAASAVRLKGSTEGAWALRRRWSMDEIEAYVRTSSAYHAYAAAHPEDAARRGRGRDDGDVVERRMAQIKDALTEDGWDGGAVDVEWPLVVMMIQRL